MGDPKTPKRHKSKRRKGQLNAARSKRLCKEGNRFHMYKLLFLCCFLLILLLHILIIAADITATNEDAGSSTLVSAMSHLQINLLA